MEVLSCCKLELNHLTSSSCFHGYREQLQHQVKLDEKEDEERLDREKSKKLAELEVCVCCGK